MTRLRGYLRLRTYLSRAEVARFLPARDFLRKLDRAVLRLNPPDVQVRALFNRWAKQGAGERMEHDHVYFTERVLDAMSLASTDRILDLGCGDGWACRLMAERAGGSSFVVGVDVSDEMVYRAAVRSGQFDNIAFLCGSAERIPCSDGCFTKVLSVSAFYYFQDQERVAAELARVVAPGGRLSILTYNYKDRPDWRRMARNLGVPVRVRSAAEYAQMLTAATWTDVRTQELWRDGRAAGETGTHHRALLVTARKPSSAEAGAGAPVRTGAAPKTR